MMRNLLLILIATFLFSCAEKDSKIEPTTGKQVNVKQSKNIKIFDQIPTTISNLDFINQITETQELNIITYDGLLQGAGVGVLDFNNDGLQDLYFASNMEEDRLYQNLGDFQFKDVTEASGITSTYWSTGVSIVDINNDGFNDIYVCSFLYDDPQKRQNKLFVNNGKGSFTEQAAKYGIADRGYSIMANFFDYDKDGDLDLYVANQPPSSKVAKEKLKGKIDYAYTDRLYRRDGDKFTDVTKTSGVENYSYSLSATTIDYNKDGWPDLYVASDYDEADFFYKNNGDGTFTDLAGRAMKHISNFSMGADVADINNDGHLDLFVCDMVAEDNFRQKTNMSGMNPAKFHALAQAGYHYQYMFNTLQLNNGDNSFSEIGQLSGVSNTDWSWTPLFMDLDQDGYKDLFVSNGIFKEIRNKDFEIWRKKFYEQKIKEAQNKGLNNAMIDPLEVSNTASSVKIANYVYKNNGDLTFSKKMTDWGLDEKTFSQGAAYADFDNDGDLDLVISNTNMPVSLYRNTVNDKAHNNYLTFKLEAVDKKKFSTGAIIHISYDSQNQISTCNPYRGYMSSSEPIVHFGIGQSKVIDLIEVIWPDNKVQRLTKVPANQILVLKHENAEETYKHLGLKKQRVLKEQATMHVLHKENEYDDFIREILLPYRTSTLGPTIATGDINGDNLNDIFIGSSFGESSQMLINKGDGTFDPVASMPPEKQYEDGGAAFFDADNDGDLDLYVSSGGNEFKANAANYQDRLYFNNGQGVYQNTKALPKLTTSNSIVLPVDYDNDGDLDLFVGGRQVPGQYGRPTKSYILNADKGKFTDVTSQVAPMFESLGMVTAAELSDLNNDGKDELIITGEWMKIGIYKLGKQIEDITSNYGLEKTNGWWNTIKIADINNDGKKDIIAGNLGHNIKYKATLAEPFKVYIDDFDKNGTNDVYLGKYEDGKCYPVRGRQCSSEQMPFVKEKFATYKDFGLATIDQVLEGKVAETTVVNLAYTFSNTVFINKGNKFEAQVLPNEAQLSPVYGIAIDDFDKDGKMDIFLAGNMYQREVETTRSDAGQGCMLNLEDNGNWKVRRSKDTGVVADKDVRNISAVKSGNVSILVVANNNDAVQFYSY